MKVIDVMSNQRTTWCFLRDIRCVKFVTCWYKTRRCREDVYRVKCIGFVPEHIDPDLF